MKITTKVCGFASHERMRGECRTVLVLGMGTSPAGAESAGCGDALVRQKLIETDGEEDFAKKFVSLHEGLRKLNAEAVVLAKMIDANFKELMG